MEKPIIKIGDKFNKLTAIRFHHRNKRSEQYWIFKCDCGNEKVIVISSVKTGNTKSCRCLMNKGNNLKHGMTGTRTHKSWKSMRDRCLNKNDTHYKNYGGRGITICSEWLGEKGFKNFLADMGDRPKNKTIDRINNNGNYCKENCRWAIAEEQMNNTRSNHLITYKNKTQSVAQWARELGINYSTLEERIKRGWKIKRAFAF